MNWHGRRSAERRRGDRERSYHGVDNGADEDDADGYANVGCLDTLFGFLLLWEIGQTCGILGSLGSS